MFFNKYKPVSTNRKILFPIRFSVLTKSKAWRISRENGFENYKSKLFSKERLESKFYLFEKLVLPNLKQLFESCDKVDMQVLLVTSSLLPPVYAQRLQHLVKDFNFITVVAIDENTKLKDPINDFVRAHTRSQKRHCAFATVRMDDDDLLSSSYIRSITKFVTSEFAGNVVSFSKGYETYYNFESKRTEHNIRVSWPRIALGLAHINFFDAEEQKFRDNILSIYGVGDHSKIDQHRPLIVDNTRGMFLRMSYVEQDTQGTGIHERIRRKDCSLVNIEEVTENFPIVTNILA